MKKRPPASICPVETSYSDYNYGNGPVYCPNEGRECFKAVLEPRLLVNAEPEVAVCYYALQRQTRIDQNG